MHFSTNKSLRDASANRTPRPHPEPAALTDGLISVYSPLSFSEVPWQHVYVLMGICIFLWLLPLTANQLKRSKSLNKYSGLFTKHRERSDGWVINAYLSDPSYGDFRLIAWGLALFALRRAMGHKCQAWDEFHGRHGWRWSVFEGFFCSTRFVCFLKRERKAKTPPLCVFVAPWANLLWACHGVPPAEHTVGPVSCTIDLKITGLHSHTICCVYCKCQATFPQREGEALVLYVFYELACLFAGKSGQTSQVDKANMHILKGLGLFAFILKICDANFNA